MVAGCSSRNLDLDVADVDPEMPLTSAGKWDCYSKPAPELVTRENPPALVSHVVSVNAYGTPDAFLDLLDVRACSVADAYCTVPIQVDVRRRLDISRYSWQIDLPFGFDGYLELSATGLLPVNYYFGGPLIGMRPNGDAQDVEDPWITSGGEITMLTYDDFVGLYQAWNLPLPVESERGMLMLRALDCDNVTAPDVGLALEAQSDVVPWITVGGVPVTHENPVMTDADGFGGFANVPPGTIVAESVVSCTPLQDGTTPAPRFQLSSIGAGAGIAASEPCSAGASETVHSRAAFRVRPGWVTITELRPHYSYRE